MWKKPGDPRSGVLAILCATKLSSDSKGDFAAALNVIATSSDPADCFSGLKRSLMMMWLFSKTYPQEIPNISCGYIPKNISSCHSSAVEIKDHYSARVAIVQPGRCSDTIVDSVENEPHVKGPTQHFAGRLAVPGASTTVEDKALMDYGSSMTATSEELAHALWGQPKLRKLPERRCLLDMRVWRRL